MYIYIYIYILTAQNLVSRKDSEGLHSLENKKTFIKVTLMQI